MPERRRVAVVFFPVGFRQQGLELLEHRRARIGRQDLELRKGRTELGRIVDRRGDRLPGVLQEPQHVEPGGHNPFLLTVIENRPLVRLRNGPAP